MDVHLQLTILLQLSIHLLLNGRPQLSIRMLDVHLQLTIHLQLSIRMLNIHLIGELHSSAIELAAVTVRYSGDWEDVGWLGHERVFEELGVTWGRAMQWLWILSCLAIRTGYWRSGSKRLSIERFEQNYVLMMHLSVWAAIIENNTSACMPVRVVYDWTQ